MLTRKFLSLISPINDISLKSVKKIKTHIKQVKHDAGPMELARSSNQLLNTLITLRQETDCRTKKILKKKSFQAISSFYAGVISCRKNRAITRFYST